MNYEVVNISTDVKTYIANGVLTHNKFTSCASSVTKDLQWGITISFGDDYVPAYPLTLEVGTSYTTFDDILGCKRFEHADGTAYKSFTITNTGQTYPYTYNVNFKRYGGSVNGAIAYSASVSGQDANGKPASGSSNTNISYKSERWPPSGIECLTPNTQLEKYDGSIVLLKDVEVGTELMSIDLKSMQKIKAVVTGKTIHSVENIYSINKGLLSCSESHLHIVKRNDKWRKIRSNKLKIGDLLLDRNFNEIQINSIDYI
jgi:hypothetical protein